jgi:hypothetical protein
MITGLQLDFQSADLVSHILARHKFHSDKAKWYRSQIESLRSGGLKPENASNDPVRSLEQSMTDHEQKAALFQVFAQHVVPDEIYRLTESDLTKLEFISRYY